MAYIVRYVAEVLDANTQIMVIGFWLLAEFPQGCHPKGADSKRLPRCGDLQRERGAVRLGTQKQVRRSDSGSRDDPRLQ